MKLLRISLTPLISKPCNPLSALNPRPACCFQGLFSGGDDVSLGKLFLLTACGEKLATAQGPSRMRGEARTRVNGKAPSPGRLRRPTSPRKQEDVKRAQNAFAPVLGGGRFTQPGADG